MIERVRPSVQTDRTLAVRGVGLGLIAVTALVRMCAAFESMPYWDADPSVLFTAATALGPAHQLLLDALVWLGAGVAFAGSRGALGRAWVGCAALATVGLMPVVWHAFIHGRGNIDDLRVGSNWAAAFVGGLTALHLARDPMLRRLTLSALLGVIGLLAAKGVVQLLIEQPATLAMYRETRQQFLESQGWSLDSSTARAFDRRISQPEATGWFGLSNVYASVAACAAVAFCGLTFTCWKGAARWMRAVLLAGALAGLGSVAMSQSKGGTAATGLGMGVLVISALVRTTTESWSARTRCLLGRSISLLCVAGAIGAVVVRGLLGERIGELSLLFRWFYMQGAVRIFAAHPWEGSGPAGFKDAYLIAKPSISPEEVTSPHSVLFDFSGTLGIAGLAWCVLWLVLAARAGSHLFSGATAPARDPALTPRQESRLIAVIAIIPTMVGALIEAPIASPEASLVRLVGMIAWALMSVGISAALRSGKGVPAIAVGVLALATHGQIEVTPIWPSTACWVLLLIGTLAARHVPLDEGARHVSSMSVDRPSGPYAVALIAALVTLAIGFFGVLPAWRWQGLLVEAAQIVRPAAEFRQRFVSLASGRPERSDSPALLARDLSDALSRPIGDTEVALRRGISEFHLASLRLASIPLGKASTHSPIHTGTLRALSKVTFQIAASEYENGLTDVARRYADAAEDSALRATTTPRERAASWGWLAALRAARAALFSEPEALDRAIEAWERSAELDPYGLSSPVQLAEASLRKGDRVAAAHWAGRALELDAQTRLDPLKGLRADQKAALTAIADGS